MVGTSTAVPYIQSGAVRGLAVTSSHRVQGLPDVPTFAEAGLPGVDVSIWFAVLVPGGTPPAIVRKLNADIAQVVADPEFKSALAARGFEARSSTPEQLADFLDKDSSSFAISFRSSACRWNDAAAGGPHADVGHARPGWRRSQRDMIYVHYEMARWYRSP